jgi:GNAT superfamily N-acetyltransferase
MICAIVHGNVEYNGVKQKFRMIAANDERRGDRVKIEKILDDKKRFLDLLLPADESEAMIDKYLVDGDLFALYDDDLRTVCVVLPLDGETCELKNIATCPGYQRRGYASAMIDHIAAYYHGRFASMLVGTGDVPSILAFYAKRGFVPSRTVKNFFIDNYERPMFDEGVRLVDMVYLKKPVCLALAAPGGKNAIAHT